MAYCERFPVSWHVRLRIALQNWPMLGRLSRKSYLLFLILVGLGICGLASGAPARINSKIHRSHDALSQDESWALTWQTKKPVSIQVRIQDGQHFIPLASVANLGWTFKKGTLDEATVTVGSNSAQVPYRTTDQLSWISLESLCERLDFSLAHDDASQSVTILPRIESIRYLAGHLIINSSANVGPTVSVASNGQLQVIFDGVALNPDVVSEIDPGLTVTSQTGNKIQFLFSKNYPVGSTCTSHLPSSRQLDIDLTQLTFQTPRPTGTPSGQPQSTTLSIKELPSHEVDVNIPIPHGPYSNIVLHQNGLSVVLDVPGIKLSLNRDSLPSSDAFHGFDISTSGTDSQIKFELAKMSGLIFGVTKSTISIRIFEPTGGPDSLVDQSSLPLFGKVLTVDPGHGGKDTGAKNLAMGIEEKTLTLQISSKLAITLAKQGATVLMSRIDDSYPTLGDRCVLANSNKCDLFLCVHINQLNNPDFRGSITFYHTGRPNSLQLAQDVQNQIAGIQAIPAIGVWRDTKIAVHEGFYVLRNTKMPSILMELGFISNRKDVLALEDANTQQQIAIAITYGAEHYLKEHNH